MDAATHKSIPGQKGRTASVDVFRALTMLTMLFVNDFAGMSGLPHWLHHAATQEDMMGFSDLVFPAFLFCVGLSIPLAIGSRFRKGDTQLQVLGHIASRTLALVVMGLFAMNLGGVEGGLSRSAYTLLAVAGFFLVWNAYPRKKDGRYPVWVRALQATGVLLLIFLVIYKDLHGMPFRHGWWGILGLIGWAYLPCSVAFLCLKGDLKKVTGFWLLTLVLCVLNASKAIPPEYSSRALILGFWPGGWTHVAICATGMLISLLLLRQGDRPRKLIASYAALAAGFLILALVSHNFWIISKNLATPTWAFYSLALSVAFFALFWWICDLKGLTRWARPVSPAGTATLTCYTIPYIWYALQGMAGLRWPAAMTDGVPGLLKALVFSFAIIGLTWLFGKIHLKLKI
ncbi:MAG: DUF5009 domain-containing protein [Bacteroidales bacterium]|nr:DUF5009 domain-containing protein [Bacteroidales bacterium]